MPRPMLTSGLLDPYRECVDHIPELQVSRILVTHELFQDNQPFSAAVLLSLTSQAGERGPWPPCMHSTPGLSGLRGRQIHIHILLL